MTWQLRLPNGYGSVKKMPGKRRKPYIIQKTIGWELDEAKGKNVQKRLTIGYAATKAEALQMLAEYNNNPFDVQASKVTFQEVYERWSKRYGIEHIHPHKLRHTMATLMIANGADIKSVSEKLGHADASITLSVYTHANEEAMTKANEVYANAIYKQA